MRIRSEHRFGMSKCMMPYLQTTINLQSISNTVLTIETTFKIGNFKIDQRIETSSANSLPDNLNNCTFEEDFYFRRNDITNVDTEATNNNSTRRQHFLNYFTNIGKNRHGYNLFHEIFD